MEKLTHKIIWRVLDHLRDYCRSRDDCEGCFYCGKVGTVNNEDVIHCTIRRIPQFWHTDEFKNKSEVNDNE